MPKVCEYHDEAVCVYDDRLKRCPWCEDASNLKKQIDELKDNWDTEHN